MIFQRRFASPLALTSAALLVFGCAGRASVGQTSGETSGGQTGGQTSGTQSSSGGQTSAQTSSTGQTSTGGGATTTTATATACTPAHGATDLLQSPLPANDSYWAAASDGQYVYFASATALYRVPTAGGAAATIYSGSFAGFYAAMPGAVAWEPASQTTLLPTGLTVESGGEPHDVAFPSGVTPAYGSLLIDTTGDVFLEVNVPSSARTHTWMWSAATGTAGEAPGIGMPAAGGGTNLYWANHGDVVWSNNLDGPTGGVYITDVATGVARQIVGDDVQGFGGLVGIDAANVYGAGSICPNAPCPFTVNGVPRAGGAPFVAFASSQSYWTNGLIADDSGLYWIDWVSHSLYHASLTEGANAQATVVYTFTGNSIPSQMALDACNVYWIEDALGSAPHVMAIAK